MTTPTPTQDRGELGTELLNRDYWLDVNTGTVAQPDWTPVLGIAEFKAGLDSNLEDSSDFDSQGWMSKTKTAQSWQIVIKLARKVTIDEPTAYDEGQEFLRARDDKTGPANTVQVRWYEMADDGPREEAYAGRATVSWSPDGGNMTALRTVTVTLDGQGRRNAITHPHALAGGSGANVSTGSGN